MLLDPTREEINKYLTEKKGYHTTEDFFTWEGLGILIPWAKRQEFWPSFVSYNHKKLEKVPGPEELTPMLYWFLKRRRGWN